MHPKASEGRERVTTTTPSCSLTEVTSGVKETGFGSGFVASVFAVAPF